MMPEHLVTKEEITNYIPQKSPIVMIDTLDFCTDVKCITSFKISENHIFVLNGQLQEPGIIENIAQSAAAKAGYEIKKQGASPFVGFIGAIKDLQIFDLPLIGETLTTTVIIKNEVMGVTIIHGTSFVKEKKIAECEMKIFIQKEIPTHA